MNIAGERQQVAIGLDENRLIASSKERAIGLMQAIVALGIETVHMPHAPREVAAGCLDQQMVMVVHEANKRGSRVQSAGGLLPASPEKPRNPRAGERSVGTLAHDL